MFLHYISYRGHLFWSYSDLNTSPTCAIKTFADKEEDENFYPQGIAATGSALEPDL